MWTVVVAGNGVIMTIFLWHLTAALVRARRACTSLGFPQPAGGTALWWATRPLWIARRARTARRVHRDCSVASSARARCTTTQTGVVRADRDRASASTLLSIVVFGIACSNLADLLANARVDIAVVTVTPLQLLAAGGAGLALVRSAARRAVV